MEMIPFASIYQSNCSTICRVPLAFYNSKNSKLYQTRHVFKNYKSHSNLADSFVLLSVAGGIANDIIIFVESLVDHTCNRMKYL